MPAFLVSTLLWNMGKAGFYSEHQSFNTGQAPFFKDMINMLACLIEIPLIFPIERQYQTQEHPHCM